jgi:hypothetical protein
MNRTITYAPGDKRLVISVGRNGASFGGGGIPQTHFRMDDVFSAAEAQARAD